VRVRFGLLFVLSSNRKFSSKFRCVSSFLRDSPRRSAVNVVLRIGIIVRLFHSISSMAIDDHPHLHPITKNESIRFVLQFSAE
jgi:hypothetical protein